MDAKGNVWTVKGGVVYQNGTLAGATGSVNSLFYYNGVIYQQSRAYPPGACGIWGWVNGGWVYGAPAGYTPAPCMPLSSSSSSSSSGSSSGGSSSSSSGASTPKAALLSYIQGLVAAGGAAKGQILSGQHLNFWDSNQWDDTSGAPNYTLGSTGISPAIMGFAFGLPGLNTSLATNAAAANQWGAAGGIIDVMWVPQDPRTGGYPASTDSAAFPGVYTPGNALNTTFNGYIDAVAAAIKSIHYPIILRMFPEENGGWFWYGAMPSTQIIALWRYTQARLLADGVSNALFMYNINAGVGNYAQDYPGADVTDIVSEDSYPPSGNDPAYAALIATGKPFMLGETGASPNQSSIPIGSYNNAQILTTIKASYPLTFAYVIWCQNLSIANQQGGAALLGGSINRPQLPAGL
jgi:mannan endo-1,4-beta-mannosidase